ncbi:MAG: choice-of-anchor R domain-containing protein [Caldilineaceae bacterium]
MKLSKRFPGQNNPFEGERTILIGALPEGARIEAALVTLTPVAPPNGVLFEERINFNGSNLGSFGATKVSGAGAVEVDFHARRTLGRVVGTPTLTGANLLVDLGGLFVDINQRGAVRAPNGDTLFTLAADGALPGLTANKFKLSRLPDTADMNVSQVTVRSAPTNVSLRLGQLAPFWTRVGEMTTPAVSTDFAEVLQTFLADAEAENGFYVLPLTIHSDLLARLDVEVAIEYMAQQSLLPNGLSETKLQFDYSTTADAQSPNTTIEVTLPVGARVLADGTNGRVLGSFDDSRIVYGPTGVIAAQAAVTVNAGAAQAQPYTPAANVTASAIDLLLKVAPPGAVLNLNLRADFDGKPDAAPLLPQSVELQLSEERNPIARWVSAKLPAEFQFKAGERYWLVLQAVNGTVEWSANPAAANGTAPLGLHFTSTGGLSWRQSKAEGQSGALDALFRLRHTPAQFSMPLAIQVGAGVAAQRVSLERFAPLGRIDFTLDIPEFAQAINTAAAQAEPTACPTIEHLANPNFEEWLRIGDQLQPLQVLDLTDADDDTNSTTPATAIDIAASGEWGYVASRDTVGNTQLHLLDPVCVAVRQSIPLASSFPLDLVIRPDESRAYLLSHHIGSAGAIALLESYAIHLIDAATHALLDAPLVLSGRGHRITVAPDNRTLYVAESFSVDVNESSVQMARVQVIDATLLEQLDRSQNVFATTNPFETIPIADNGVEPVGLVLSPDGRQLYVAVRDTTAGAQSGRIHVFNTTTKQPVAIPIEINDGTLSGIAISPDNKTLAATLKDMSEGNDGTLRLIDLNRRTVLRDLSIEFHPIDVIFAPNGRRAFVVDEEMGNLAVIDLPNRTIETTLNRNNTVGQRLAITPQGDMLFVTNRDEASLTTLQIGLRAPTEWAQTSGAVSLACLPEPHHLAAVLGTRFVRKQTTATASAIAQITAAAGGCAYAFSFWALSSAPGARAELVWRGAGCAAQRVDEIPIQVVENRLSTRPGLIRQPVSFVGSAAVAARNTVELALHRLETSAPISVTQVEVRFYAPPDAIAIIDNVSLRGSNDVLANGDLRQMTDDALVGWTLEPAGATTALISVTDAGLLFDNRGVSEAALVQTIAPGADAQFELTVAASATLGVQAQMHPFIELNWLTAQGALAGAPALLEVTPDDTGAQPVTLTRPATATQAELRLTAPAHTSLLLQQVSLRAVQTVTVPINFVAQSPGEMVVRNLAVAYDVSEPATPPMPAGGLCTPSLPGPRVGKSADECCFCPCCQEETEFVAPKAVATPAGNPAQIGRCVNCGTALVRMGGTLEAARPSSLALFQPRRLVAAQPAIVRRVTAPLALFQPVTVALPPLTTITGIGEARAAQLAEMGIDSVAKLAVARPEEIAVLRGVSREMAIGFIRAAQRLI